ncbi:uncharacterized protein LOC135820818 [Sycon ciliatum]|uniref:uncharacterized protein LOC135820818 n=1 Tax=Sycon ciliatum TaxID=27933 RepID=UPI0031F6EBF2
MSRWRRQSGGKSQAAGSTLAGTNNGSGASVGSSSSSGPLLDDPRGGGGHGSAAGAGRGAVSWQDLGQTRSHQTYLAQCGAWQADSRELRRLVKEYCKLAHQASACLQDITKVFCSLLKSTPVWQASVAFQQAAQASEESARKFRVQMTHDVLGTLRGFTELLPAVEESVHRHKQSADEVDQSQTNLETVQAKQASMMLSASPGAGTATMSFSNDSSDGASSSALRLGQEKEDEALCRLQAASVSFAEEDGKLASVWSALEETRKKLVGSALVSSMNCLGWRSKHESELFCELGKYQDIGSLEDSIVHMDPIKHASQQWMSVAMSNSRLRDRASLSANDIQCITLCRNQDDMPEPMRDSLSSRIDELLESYMAEFNALPDSVTCVPAGFHHNPESIEKALKSCCTDLEAKAAGFCGMEMTDPAALRPQMLLDLPRSQCTIGSQFFDSVPYNEANAAFEARLKCVEDLVRRGEQALAAKKPDKPKAALRSYDRHDLAEFLLSHTCNTITNAAAKTAVQLVFGKAYLVLVKPSSDHRYQRASTIELRSSQLTVTVPSMWWLVEDAPTFGPVRVSSDLTKPLGVVNANYTLSVDISTAATATSCWRLNSTSFGRH